MEGVGREGKKSYNLVVGEDLISQRSLSANSRGGEGEEGESDGKNVARHDARGLVGY